MLLPRKAMHSRAALAVARDDAVSTLEAAKAARQRADALAPALDRPATEGPRAVLLHTVKGKGIPQFEDDPVWHARKIKGDELEVGKKALGIP